MSGKKTVYDHIHQNNVHTAVLVALFPLIFIALVFLFAWCVVPFYDAINTAVSVAIPTFIACILSDLHEKLERELADFEKKEAAFLFNFGYQGIVSTIDSLLTRHDVIVFDAECPHLGEYRKRATPRREKRRFERLHQFRQLD